MLSASLTDWRRKIGLPENLDDVPILVIRRYSRGHDLSSRDEVYFQVFAHIANALGEAAVLHGVNGVAVNVLVASIPSTYEAIRTALRECDAVRHFESINLSLLAPLDVSTGRILSGYIAAFNGPVNTRTAASELLTTQAHHMEYIHGWFTPNPQTSDRARETITRLTKEYGLR